MRILLKFSFIILIKPLYILRKALKALTKSYIIILLVPYFRRSVSA